jgi:hypothetical protein
MSKSGLLREPFVHFAILGLLLFGLWEGVGSGDLAELGGVREVSIRLEEVEMLSLSFAERNGRDPSPVELDAMVSERADEEILYLEGLAAGLHLGDPVVRRRVIQKERFLLEELSLVVGPSDAEVDARIEEQPERYRKGQAVAFNHHFFDAERRRNAEDDARRALVDFDASETPLAGDPFVHGPDFGLRSLDAHRVQLGPAFAAVLAELAVGKWELAQSRWGWHLVQVTERASAAELTEASVRSQARFDMLEERRAEGVERGLEAARSRYHVTVEGRE